MKPSIVLSNSQEQCLTFFWSEMPGTYLGYRFYEGQPTILSQPVSGYENLPAAQFRDLPELSIGWDEPPVSTGWNKTWLRTYDEHSQEAPVQLTSRVFANGVATCNFTIQDGEQSHELTFQPVTYGVRMWYKLTSRVDIPGAYCLQQCLRMTGAFNAEWRQSVARIPFLSELDMQAMGNANGTLTYTRRDQHWHRFPVQHTVYPAKLNFPKDQEQNSICVDEGLIVRETPSRTEAPASYWEKVAPHATWEQIACGMYWERSAYVINRHPADCIHAWLDFGPLQAGRSRTLRGAVYYLEGSKDDLLAVWGREFIRP